MSWRKRLLRNSKLYLVLDKDTCSNRLMDIARKAVGCGTDIIQLRNKSGTVEDKIRQAKVLRRLTKDKSLFIVNDNIDVALASGADGVHLGQDDIPIEIARRIIGKKILIGVSCHNLNQAKEAQSKGADYIGIGPIFSTPTKPRTHSIGPKVLSEVKKSLKIPFFAIGGINQNNIKQVLDYNVKKVAVIRAVCKSKNINKTVNNLKSILN